MIMKNSETLLICCAFICITVVAMWFELPRLLWWYLVPGIMAIALFESEDSQNELP
jgi:hypothetical protein